MISSQIQSFDAAFGGSSQTSSTGASWNGTWNGTTHPAWLNGIGAQFAGHSSGLSGEKRKVNNEKLCPDASDRNGRLLTAQRSDIV